MPKRQMLVNYVPGEECRIAITEDGRLEEFYQERASNESHVGNIYKGKVCNVEPSIQAAFIEFGLERNGFLHISDLHPKYFPGDHKEETEQVGLKTPRRDRPPIQKCLRRGQEILVQVLKEGIGTKGPTLTSYLSIPGRYLVMMPHMEKMGVSRKVEDDEARRASRDILNDLKPPAGFGFIIRTAGIGRTKTDLKRDLAYLQRLWKNIDRRMKEVRIGELFAESDLVIRTIRDIYSSDIERIIVDEETAARRARDFLTISNPRSGSNVMVYKDQIPLFHRYDVERQIETINAKIVPLPSGGSLVIESTEALVAIDVNSGKYRDNRDAEMTAYKVNVEAADEICRQLRLRDLGGVVVNDLIDMRSLSHRREIEGRFRDNLKRDRARTRTLPISQFGILEMTRQRMRPSLKKSIYTDCPSCAGAGLVKSPESVVLDVMRRLALAMHRQQVARLELTVSPDVAFLLLNRKRSQLVGVEQTYGKPVTVRVNGGGGIDFVQLAGFDARGGAVDAEVLEPMGEPTLEPAEGPTPEPDDTALFEEGEEGLAETEGDGDESRSPDEDVEAVSEPIDQPFTQDREDSRSLPSDREESSFGGADDEHDAGTETVDTGRSPSGPPQPRPAVGGGQGEPGQPGEGGRRRRRRRRGRRGRGGGQGGQVAGPAGQPGGEAQGQPLRTPNDDRSAQPYEAPLSDNTGGGGTDQTEHAPEPYADGGSFDAESEDVHAIDDAPGNELPPPEDAAEPTEVNGNLVPGAQPGPGQAPGAGKRRRRRRGGRGRRGRGRGGAPGAPGSGGGGGGTGGPGGSGGPAGGGGSGGSGGGSGGRGPSGGGGDGSRGYRNPQGGGSGGGPPTGPMGQ